MLSFLVLLSLLTFIIHVYSTGNTSIAIDGVNFKINGEITYNNAKNQNVHGILINARLINAIFDNSNNAYNYLFAYPDGKWDPTRNSVEFVSNLTKYKENGMVSFTVGLQGGNPFGYGHNEPNNVSGQPWINSAYDVNTGELIQPYFERLSNILSETDNIGMTPIIQMFYNAQINKMKNDTIIMRAINNTLDWLIKSEYTNFLIEVTNECNGVQNDILGEGGMSNTMAYIRKYTNNKYLLSSSLTGGKIPSDDLISSEDFILLHGNGQSPESITNMINKVRSSQSYKNKPKPIVFNEDDHYDFTKSTNNFKSAVEGHAGWGVFVDCNQTTAGDYFYGYQCVPAAWSINTPIKQGFFEAVKNYTAT